MIENELKNTQEDTKKCVADAQYNLGIGYTYGHEVSIDYKEAVKWYRKAVEQEDAKAQYNLGICYAKGEGVSQDYEEAMKWHQKLENKDK